jgi:hypothetical protein
MVDRVMRALNRRFDSQSLDDARWLSLDGRVVFASVHELCQDVEICFFCQPMYDVDVGASRLLTLRWKNDALQGEINQLRGLLGQVDHVSQAEVLDRPRHHP